MISSSENICWDGQRKFDDCTIYTSSPHQLCEGLPRWEQMIKEPIKRYGQVRVITLYCAHICLASQQEERALNFLDDPYSLNWVCKRVVKSWWPWEDILWSGCGDLGDEWGAPYKDPEMTSDQASPPCLTPRISPPGERQRPPDPEHNFIPGLETTDNSSQASWHQSSCPKPHSAISHQGFLSAPH